MRAVCLREPWLFLMLDIEDPDLRKTIENRSSKITKTLGPVLVKSSAPKRVSVGSPSYDNSDLPYYCRVRRQVLSWGWFPEELFPTFSQLQFGGIRGALNFADLLEPGDLRDREHRWKFPECFGYVVDRYVRFPFRPLKGGGQGIFYTEPTAEERALMLAAGLVLPSQEA